MEEDVIIKLVKELCKGLQELIKRITENKVEKVVVLYKDRLLGFGFELVEYLTKLYHCEMEVIDNTEKIRRFHRKKKRELESTLE